MKQKTSSTPNKFGVISEDLILGVTVADANKLAMVASDMPNYLP